MDLVVNLVIKVPLLPSTEEHGRELEVTFTTSKAVLEVDTGRLIFANGERCEYSSEQCDTADYGNIYWKRTVPTCIDKIPTVTVYKGLGELVTTIDKANRTMQLMPRWL